jgi:DNA-binding response OmpR family regulator
MPDTDLAGTRVLLVEDETLIAMLLEDAIAELGCKVVGPAARVDTAQRMIEHERFDCALVDLKLRGHWAYPLAQMLEARGVPFGFVTGYNRDRVDTRFRSRPVLHKPFNVAQLKAVLVSMDRQGRGPAAVRRDTR